MAERSFISCLIRKRTALNVSVRKGKMIQQGLVSGWSSVFGRSRQNDIRKKFRISDREKILRYRRALRNGTAKFVKEDTHREQI